MVQKLRGVIRQEIHTMECQRINLDDESIGISGIASILGHSEDWCRRRENRTYPHYMVGHRIMASKNKLSLWARQNGFIHA